MDENSPSLWHAGTSTTNHMTDNQGILHTVTKYLGPNGVIVGNGEVLPITHVG